MPLPKSQKNVIYSTDILIGSYMSDAVAVLRSRPIVKLTSNITLHPHEIPLNSSGLQCQQDDFNPCTTIRFCFNYTGTDVPSSIGKDMLN